ncbi:MAG: hypothetical protein JWP35_3499 [Caulobacter sp.]|nr:hypothetical protein [Caulobacter sp.]
MLGICRWYDCRRRVSPDLGKWVERGYGQALVSDMVRMLRCNRVDTDCGLMFDPEPPAVTLRLSQLTWKANVRLRFSCAAVACKATRFATAEAVMDQLRRQGHRNADFRVEELASLMKGACRTCKGTAWSVDVMWANTNTMGWRSGGRPWPT